MKYLFVLMFAFAGAYLVTVLYDNRVAKRTDNIDAVLNGLQAEKQRFRWLRFDLKWAIVAGVLGFLILPKTGSLILVIIVGLCVYIALLMVSANPNETKIEDVEAILVFAETVFPLLGSSLSLNSVLDQSSVALSPKLRSDWEEVRKYADQNGLRQSQIMHLFAIMENSSEIDLIMSIMAITFDLGSESIDDKIGQTVIDILNGALSGLQQAQRDRQELMLGGKIISMIGVGLLELIMYTTSSLVPGAWNTSLAAVVIVLVSLMTIGAAAIFRRLARPRASIRLVDPEYVMRNLRQKNRAGV